MAVTDAQRLQVHRAFEDTMGKDTADLILEHLPPGGWTTLATQNDLLMTETRLTSRIDGLSYRIDGLEHRIDGLEHRIDGLEHRIDGLADRINGLASRIDGLDGRMKWFISSVLAVGLALFGSQIQIYLAISRL